MAITAINVEIIGCSPAPANDYNVKYQVTGDSVLIDAGNFPAGIAVIPVDYPDGTDFEGIIRADCGGGVFGTEVPWEFINDPAPTVIVVNTSPAVTIEDVIGITGFTFGPPLVGSGTREGFHDAFTGTVDITVSGTPISGSVRLIVNAVLIDCINVGIAGSYSFPTPITVIPGDIIEVEWISSACPP